MQYIEIEKKKYAVSFNMAAFLEIDKWVGMPISSILSEEGVEASNWMKLLFLGLKFGADETRRKFDMTYSAFVVLMEANQEKVEELSNIVTADITIILELQAERYKLENPVATDADESKKNLIPSGPSMSDVSVA